jgi:hypothetical protein
VQIWRRTKRRIASPIPVPALNFVERGEGEGEGNGCKAS